MPRVLLLLLLVIVWSSHELHDLRVGRWDTTAGLVLHILAVYILFACGHLVDHVAECRKLRAARLSATLCHCLFVGVKWTA